MPAMAQKSRSLVILPGSLCDRWAYAQQIAALSQGFAITVPHLTDHETLDEMAEAVLAAAPPRFAVIGHAMGGRVALELIRRAAGRIEALALIATTVHPVRPGEDARRQSQIDQAFNEGMAALAAAWLPKVLHAEALANAPLMQGLTEMYCRFTAEDYQREVRALLKRPDPRPLLDSIRCPTLILSGRDDPLCTPEQSESLAGQIHGAGLDVIDRCAHFPTVEKPERVTRALSDWAAYA
jgi:pimeloyl-ACP methyl ester carboxylesterase